MATPPPNPGPPPANLGATETSRPSLLHRLAGWLRR